MTQPRSGQRRVSAEHRGGRLVVALGGNALIERHQVADAAPQQRNIARAVSVLAPLAATNELVITHGNGPQVGLLALESAADRSITAAYPLDALVAETQGLIGYWLQVALHRELPGREVAVLLTETEVDPADPAFEQPTKFIGAVYPEADAHALADARGWTMHRDGSGWRRVVASPAPKAIVELSVIRRLVDAGTIVVCAGGGGVAVVRGDDGRLQGAEAVVDKDLTTALLASALQSDRLLLLTDVPAVSSDIDDPAAPPILHSTPAAMRQRSFPAGSMGPKVDAACRFVEQGGAMAAIGALADAGEILAGRAGTIITASGSYR